MIKTILKDNIDQTVLSFDQKTFVQKSLLLF